MHQSCRGDLKYRFATVLNEWTPGAKRGEGVSHSEPTVAQILKQKKKEAKKSITQRWAGRGVQKPGSLVRNATAPSNPDGARTSALLPVPGRAPVVRCIFSPPSFPEPWHWGVWNGSTCCNRTCELLLVAKLLQQPLH